MRSKYCPKLLLLILYFFVAIPFNAQCQNIKWPDAWPANMSIKTSYCCGSRLDSKTIFISADNSYVEEQTTGEKSKQRLTLSFNETELKELLTILKKNNAAGLKSTARKNTTADKSILSINFSYAGKDYVVSTSSTEELSTHVKERFDIIFNYVDKLTEKKRLTSKVPFVFSFHRSIIQSGKALRIRIENANITINFKSGEIPSSAAVELFPLEYEMQVWLIDPGKNEDVASDAYFSETMLKVNIQEHKQITLLLDVSQLNYKY